MTRGILIGVYFAGLALAEAFRLPRHVRRAQQSLGLMRRLTHGEKAVLAVLALGVWIAPALYAFTSWLAFANYHLPSWTAWTAVSIFGLGLWIRWLAHRALGSHYSSTVILQQGHQLVTEGIYGRIRHPIYAALWLWALAQPGLLWNWIAGPAALISVSVLTAVRVPREEAMLRAQFGEAYDDYVARTGRVCPRLRRPSHPPEVSSRCASVEHTESDRGGKSTCT
ncbi:MAG: isoprenylcysteine carboxylmethyltransferase family protein [Anaerolineae bacterium]|nr:isoprenylcysteine carboxylmethyltransferase family protein [Anaerolineae bacterium]